MPVLHDGKDAGGTIPGKESVESSLEQRPRVTQDEYRTYLAENVWSEFSSQNRGRLQGSKR